MVKDFMNPDPKFQFYPFICDLAIGKVTDPDKAGMFSMKIAFNNITKSGSQVDFKKVKAWSRPPPKRMISYKLRCFIYQCKDLPSADSTGSSDPYVEVWTTEKEKPKTPVVDDNNNPLLFSTLETFIDITKMEEAPPIVLNVFDFDEGVLSDSADFLGRALIYVRTTAVVDFEIRCKMQRYPKTTQFQSRSGTKS